VLDKEADPDLKVYMVWVPMFRGMERDVATASREMPDRRVRHYWDGDSLLVKGYRATLGFDEDAWDIFLIYGPEAKWDGDQPPPPRYFMHQLGSASRPRVDGPYLDADVFLAKLREVSTAGRGNSTHRQLPAPHLLSSQPPVGDFASSELIRSTAPADGR
jgi:hypothetical protein